MAIETSGPNPNTVPRATSARGRQWRRSGHGSRRTATIAMAIAAASNARPIPTKNPPSSGAAMRVNGSVKLNASTPMKPRSMPSDPGDIAGSVAWRGAAIVCAGIWGRSLVIGSASGPSQQEYVRFDASSHSAPPCATRAMSSRR
jgi:hypothetical protein